MTKTKDAVEIVLDNLTRELAFLESRPLYLYREVQRRDYLRALLARVSPVLRGSQEEKV